MFIRVNGTLKKIIYVGENNISILVKTSFEDDVVVTGHPHDGIMNELIPGQKIDFICKLKTRTREKNQATFYNNSVYVVDVYPNIEKLGGELHERETPGQETG